MPTSRFYNPMVKACNIFGTLGGANAHGLTNRMVDHILLSSALITEGGLCYVPGSLAASEPLNLGSDRAAIGVVLAY